MQTALKIPFAGNRHWSSGAMTIQAGYGIYWSSSPDSVDAYYLYFNSSNINPSNSNFRAFGFSLRCFKN